MNLMPYQQQGVDWLRNRHRSLLADEQGLGKTVQALKAIADSDFGTVIVCPATLKSNWANEVRMWTGLEPIILSGKGSWQYPDKGEVVIMNYDILPDWLEPLRIIGQKRGKPIYSYIQPETAEKSRLIQKVDMNVIFDEAHYAKNPDTTRTHKARTLAYIANGKVIGMSGTPLDSKPEDLFGIMQFLGLHETFGFKYVTQFRSYWGGQMMRFGQRCQWAYNPKAPKDCPERLQRVMLRRMKKDVLPQLPRKQYFERYVDCDPALRRSLDKEYGSALGKYLNADTLPPFEEFSAVRRDLAVAKIPAMLEFVEEYDCEPLVVCSAHVAPIERLAKLDGWRCITGTTSHTERAEIVRLFQAGQLNGIGLTTAGWAGITLTAARTMLFVSLDWKPGTNQQGEDRIHRIGQDRECRYFRLTVDHPLERRLHSVLDIKRGQQDGSVNAARRAG